MDKNIIHKNSKTEWYTPEWVFKMFGPFYLDPCTTFELIDKNKKYIEIGYTKETNGLTENWWGKVWVNPPFNEKKLWIMKARNEMDYDKNVDIWMLLPLSLNSKIWHTHILGYAEIFIPDKRIKFSNTTTSPNFDSCIVHFTREKCNKYTVINI